MKLQFAPLLQNLALAKEQRRLMLSSGFLLGMVLIVMILSMAIFILYTTSGDWKPWALPHLFRTILGIGLMAVIISIPMRIWYSSAYLLYVINLILLLLVPFWGTSLMGAQRWLGFGPFIMQPSEPMKLFIIMALARYFHHLEPREISKFMHLFPAAMIVILPVILILRQPDLGTSLLIVFAALVVFFLAAVHWKFFIGLGLLGTLSGPIIWFFGMHDFQRQRILSFLNPDQDLLGAGYQLMQSKIAIGSGGIWGMGFLQGTQNQLGFIPAKHTDFVFSVFAEQFGFVGVIMLLLLLFLLLIFCAQTAASARSGFGRILALSLGTMWTMQSLINLGMVVGLLPVVGIPLPFLSYGGTSLWTSMAGFGLVMNVYIYQFQGLKSEI